MTGGVARNTGVVKALERELGVRITVSDIQQLNGAFGAAVYGYGKAEKGSGSAAKGGAGGTVMSTKE